MIENTIQPYSHSINVYINFLSIFLDIENKDLANNTIKLARKLLVLQI